MITPRRLATVVGIGIGGGLTTIGVLASCKAPPPSPPVSVVIRVLDESRNAVPGAQIAAASAVVATTNANGQAVITVTGPEGASYPVQVRCPPGYRSPDASIEVRRLEGPSTPEYLTRCSKLRHHLVVNVRATGAGAPLRIMHLSKEVAKTDAAGNARIDLVGEVLERFDLTLDTSDPSLAKLHPMSPTASFEIGERDGETSFDLKFTRDAKIAPKVVKKTGPKEL